LQVSAEASDEVVNSSAETEHGCSIVRVINQPKTTYAILIPFYIFPGLGGKSFTWNSNIKGNVTSSIQKSADFSAHARIEKV